MLGSVFDEMRGKVDFFMIAPTVWMLGRQVPDQKDTWRNLRTERIARNVKKYHGLEWNGADEQGYSRLLVLREEALKEITTDSETDSEDTDELDTDEVADQSDSADDDDFWEETT